MRRVFVFFFWTATAAAQGNFVSTPTGGRTALMGHTGTALGTDGAAAFLNPATLSRADWLLSVSVNLVGGETMTIHRYYAPGRIDPAVYGDLTPDRTTITRLGFDVLPTTVCLFMNGPRIGHATTEQGTTKLAMCFGSYELDKLDYVGHFYGGGAGRVTSELQSVFRTWQRFVLAPTMSVQVTPDVAIGASIWTVFSNSNALMSQAAVTSGNGNPVASAYTTAFNGNAVGFSPLVGMTARTGRWMIGAAVQAPDATFFGDAHVSESSTHGNFSTVYGGAGSYHPMAPWRISLGAARQWQWSMVEANVNVGIPQDVPFRVSSNGTRTTMDGAMLSREPAGVVLTERPSFMLEAGLGAEIYPIPPISVLGGTYASLTFNPSAGGVLPTRQSRVGISGGLGSHGKGGDLIAGLDLSYEWGNTIVPNGYVLPPQLEQTNIDGFRVLFVLAGSTSLQTIARGLKDIVTKPSVREEQRVKENREQPTENPPGR